MVPTLHPHYNFLLILKFILNLPMLLYFLLAGAMFDFSGTRMVAMLGWERNGHLVGKGSSYWVQNEKKQVNKIKKATTTAPPGRPPPWLGWRRGL